MPFRYVWILKKPSQTATIIFLESTPFCETTAHQAIITRFDKSLDQEDMCITLDSFIGDAYNFQLISATLEKWSGSHGYSIRMHLRAVFTQ